MVSDVIHVCRQQKDWKSELVKIISQIIDGLDPKYKRVSGSEADPLNRERNFLRLITEQVYIHFPNQVKSYMKTLTSFKDEMINSYLDGDFDSLDDLCPCQSFYTASFNKWSSSTIVKGKNVRQVTKDKYSGLKKFCEACPSFQNSAKIVKKLKLQKGFISKKQHLKLEKNIIKKLKVSSKKSTSRKTTRKPIRRTARRPIRKTGTARKPIRRATSKKPYRRIGTSRRPVRKVGTSRKPYRRIGTSRRPVRKIGTSRTIKRVSYYRTSPNLTLKKFKRVSTIKRTVPEETFERSSSGFKTGSKKTSTFKKTSTVKRIGSKKSVSKIEKITSKSSKRKIIHSNKNKKSISTKKIKKCHKI